jgi:hypothetical protein
MPLAEVGHGRRSGVDDAADDWATAEHVIVA